MPIYEYECSCCHKITEAVQKFSDAPLSSCGHCRGELRKLISRSTFHLRGSGWYVTDYAGKNPGSSTAPSCSGQESSKESSKSESKTESASTEAAS
jgi:putative FmdB family regulatory protein